MSDTSALHATIIDACELLDPQHQGIGWPDPIKCDGRPLPQQARDMCALLDARAEDSADARFSDLSQRLWSMAAPPKS